MTKQTGTAVTAKAESLATQAGVLELNKTVLIGIVGNASTPSALLRAPNGAITKVIKGDKTSEGTVIAIDARSISLQKGGKVRVLGLPPS